MHTPTTASFSTRQIRHQNTAKRNSFHQQNLEPRSSITSTPLLFSSIATATTTTSTSTLPAHLLGTNLSSAIPGIKLFDTTGLLIISHIKYAAPSWSVASTIYLHHILHRVINLVWSQKTGDGIILFYISNHSSFSPLGLTLSWLDLTTQSLKADLDTSNGTLE
ncbi:hypothetical protein HELRODRAFT_178200 [Helobdella robusta]|uniref:Uncharacterized protein n=1 Tax=Helobdella robusta TaxID=6412 RepID=T1FCX7_HELRO|nr:hypothetical protein HELRODRAFT_178200 [Helobdella robusta]ESN97409.1 hypothetical protein HELRODRAFT_178200 [Helobdella robusta]